MLSKILVTLAIWLALLVGEAAMTTPPLPGDESRADFLGGLLWFFDLAGAWLVTMSWFPRPGRPIFVTILMRYVSSSLVVVLYVAAVTRMSVRIPGETSAALICFLIWTGIFLATSAAQILDLGAAKFQHSFQGASRMVDGKRFDLGNSAVIDRRLLLRDGALFHLIDKEKASIEESLLPHADAQRVAGALATLALGSHVAQILKALTFVFRLRLVFLCKTVEGAWFVVINPGVLNDFRPVSPKLAQRFLSHKPNIYEQHFRSGQ